MTVILAVYNGEKYLAEQIDSLLNQTVPDFRIVIRDDGSSDESRAVIAQKAAAFRDRISVLETESRHGAVYNFAELWKNVDDDYIMFCDQDDVWLDNKVEVTLAAMKRAEERFPDTPVLVHTDLTVVNEDLRILAPSFFKFQKVSPERDKLNQLLPQNNVTGCTVMVNRKMKEICPVIPEEAAMHDWWLALTASLFGKTVCVPDATILYRQHRGNVVGAKRAGGFGFIRHKLSELSSVRYNYRMTFAQARALLKYYDEMLNATDREIISAYCRMENMPRRKKIVSVRKYGFRKNTFIRNLGQYFLM